MPRALVTGATGLLGSHIVERLLTDGWSVRALVRDSAHREWLAARGVELARGDILNPTAFVGAARGCDTIFHTAAAVTPHGGWEAFRVPNVEGARNAVRAAESSGARLLQVSSVAVYGPTARYRVGGGDTDERSPLSPLPQHAYYARSKRESEIIVLDAHASGRIWATAVRPSVIYGPRDRQFVPRIARLLSLSIAPLVAGGESTLAVVHAANVADGAVRAATSDVAGGRAFNLANDFDVSVRDFLRLAGEGLGRHVRFIPVPLWLARAGMKLFKATVALSGGSLSVVSTASLNFLTRDNPFSSQLARSELGWSPTVRPETGVPEAFRLWKNRAGRD